MPIDRIDPYNLIMVYEDHRTPLPRTRGISPSILHSTLNEGQENPVLELNKQQYQRHQAIPTLKLLR